MTTSTAPTTVRSVAAAVGPAVVRIGRHGRGTGVVLEDGAVATNAHNLRGTETTVTFADGRRAPATLAGHDLHGDLAVLHVDTGDAPPVTWGGTADLGDPVLAVGLTGDGVTRVTVGTVSATGRAFRGPRGRRIAEALEHTAPLPRGSSGGPIVDEEGRLVGLNTHRPGDGLYLAVPADDALRQRLARLAAGESPVPRRLGVGLAPAHVARALRRSVGLPERDGLLVRLVEESSPAAAGGIEEGDLLVSAGGRPLATVDDLHTALAAVGEDGGLTLGVVRGADERDLTIDMAVAGLDTAAEG